MPGTRQTRASWCIRSDKSFRVHGGFMIPKETFGNGAWIGMDHCRAACKWIQRVLLPMPSDLKSCAAGRMIISTRIAGRPGGFSLVKFSPIRTLASASCWRWDRHDCCYVTQAFQSRVFHDKLPKGKSPVPAENNVCVA